MDGMECLRQPVFVVGDIDESINLSLPPCSGEEYIKRVVIEAQQYADVVVAEIDRELVKNPTVDIGPVAECIEAPPWLGPTLEWQQCQIADFSDIRLYLSQLKNEIQTCKRKWRPPNIELPDRDNENGWIQVCTDTYKGQQFSPTLNVLFCLNQPTVEQVLENLVAFVERKGTVEHKLGQWIYALLAILELPLNPDACSCLRSLARACSVIRANSSKLEVHEVGALNLFICLVARYFRQLDLADP